MECRTRPGRTAVRYSDCNGSPDNKDEVIGSPAQHSACRMTPRQHHYTESWPSNSRKKWGALGLRQGPVKATLDALDILGSSFESVTPESYSPTSRNPANPPDRPGSGRQRRGQRLNGTPAMLFTLLTVVNDPENVGRSVLESLTFFIHDIHRGGLGCAIRIGPYRFSEIELRSPAAEEGHERRVGS